MREYIFILGREPELSFLEVISFFKSRDITYKIVEHKNEVVIFLLDERIDFDNMIRKLGGVVKIAEIFSEYKYNGNDNKLNFGISVYKGSSLKLKSLLIKEFRKEKVKAMIRKSKEKVFSPSEIVSKKLYEFIVYGEYSARTIAFFNPRLYMQRDEKRPKLILLHQVSLRLAKILINLSQAKKNILDPFCGAGTILQEAMLNELDVVGVDIDNESIEASKENLSWLKEKYNIDRKFEIIKGDSTKLTRYFKRNSIEGIATEPYMGPYYKKMPERDEVVKVARELEKIYYEFFLQAGQVLKKNCKIAIVIPKLKYFNGSVNINIDRIIKETGFRTAIIDRRVKFPVVSKGRFLDRMIYVFEK